MIGARRTSVAVVGAGIAGLAAAWELVRAGTTHDGEPVSVVVVDGAPSVGGKLRAKPFAGRRVDMAPDSFLARRPEAVDLVHELGLGDELVPVGASGAAIFARGRLRPMPAGLQLGLPTRWWPLARSGILSWPESLALARDLVGWPRRRTAPGVDRSVGAIVEERLGKAVVRRLADPLIGGIHAGGVDDLSAAATFPMLLAASERPGSLMRHLRAPDGPGAARGTAPGPAFWSMREGVASLAEHLGTRLAAEGVELVTGATVDAVELHRGRWSLVAGAGDRRRRPGRGLQRRIDVDGLVLALPAPQAAVLLAPHSPQAATVLSTIEYASVVVVTLAFPAGAVRTPLGGTGFLVPRHAEVAGRPALMTGCTYLSRKWPHLARSDDELLRVSVGRFGDERAAGLDDDELVAAVTAELDAVLGLGQGPFDTAVVRWNPALPQYRPGHLERVATLEEALAALPAAAVAGAALRGVGIPACIGSGRRAARDVLAALGAERASAGAGGPEGT